MEKEEDSSHLLAREMAEFWFESRVRCDRIEELVKRLKEKKE